MKSLHIAEELGWSDPAGITAAQHGALVGARLSDDPPRRLMEAVLAAAVHDYLASAHARTAPARATFKAASRWIHAPGSTWPFCFENICATLGLDADGVRRGLARQLRRASGRERSSRLYFLRHSVGRRAPRRSRSESVAPSARAAGVGR